MEQRTAIDILEEFLPGFAEVLLGCDETITGEVANSGSVNWSSDACENLVVHFADANTIEFSVDLYFSGDWEGENSFLGTQIVATIKGKATAENGIWRVSDYSVLDTKMYPRDDDPDEEMARGIAELRNADLNEMLSQDEDSVVRSLLDSNYSAEDLNHIQSLEWLGKNRARVLAAIVQLKRDITG